MPAGRRRRLAALEVAASTGIPLTARGGGTSVAGNAVGTGHRPRLLPAPEPGARGRPGRRAPPGRARRRPGRPAAAGARRTACGSGPTRRPRPAHARRHDRQQRLRPARGRLRPHGRQRRGLDVVDGTAGGSRRRRRRARRRHPGPGRAGRRRTWRRSAPSSAGSAGRSPATRSSTCCPSTAAPGQGAGRHRGHPRHAARRDRAAGPDRRRRRCSSCSATRTWPPPPTPSRRCSRTRPLAVEGLDARLVDVVRAPPGPRRARPAAGRRLADRRGGRRDLERGAGPARSGWPRRRHAPRSRVVPAGPEATALWRIREDGAGLAGRTPAGAQAWPGWEDAAVPPDAARRLPARLRDADGRARRRRPGLRALRRRLRARAPRPAAGARAAPRCREFLRTRRGLVAAHGGSLSGRARRRPGPQRAAAARCTRRRRSALFAESRTCSTRPTCSTPASLVRPAPARRRPAPPARPARCCADGAGSRSRTTTATSPRPCTAASASASAAPTPPPRAASCARRTWRRATRRTPPAAAPGCCRSWRTARWSPAAGRSPEVRESLDLCLSCKACSKRLPGRGGHGGVQVRGAAPRVPGPAPPDEPLRARLAAALDAAGRPAAGWRRLANARARLRARWRRLVLRAGGMDPRRTCPRSRRAVPALGPHGRDAAVGRPGRGRPAATGRAPPGGAVGRLVHRRRSTPDVAPGRGAGAARTPGYRVVVPVGHACCGLTWITTGQLDGARRRLRGLLDVLGPFAATGSRSSGWSRPAPPCCARTCVELLPGRPARGRGRAAPSAPSPSCSPAPRRRPGTVAAARPGRRAASSRSRTATSTR